MGQASDNKSWLGGRKAVELGADGLAAVKPLAAPGNGTGPAGSAQGGGGSLWRKSVQTEASLPAGQAGAA